MIISNMAKQRSRTLITGSKAGKPVLRLFFSNTKITIPPAPRLKPGHLIFLGYYNHFIMQNLPLETAATAIRKNNRLQSSFSF
jgi:hypothetical protein